MTQRNRRRQRRRGGIGSKLADRRRRRSSRCSRSASSRVTSWVLDVAADAPSLATCKPVEQGGNSTIYAADGSKLGVIASDEARTPVSIERDPQEPAAGDGGDRGPALLRARRRRPRGHPPRRAQEPRSRQGGRGRLDDHPAAGPQPLHPQTRERDLERKIVEAKLAIEYAKRHSRREILGQYLNVASYGTIEGSTAVGVQARRADLLLQAGLEAEPASSRRCWPACRRRPPNTTRSSTRRRRWRGATRCCARWRKLGYVSAAARRGGAAGRPRPRRRPTTTSSTASPTSSTTSKTS